MLSVHAKRTANRHSQLFWSLTPTQEARQKHQNSSDKLLFSYYDAECQLVFEQGKIEPIQATNYISPPISSRNGAEVNLPQIEQFRPSRSRSQLRMQFTLESTKAMPYGLAVWGNHAGLTLATSKCTGSDVVRRSVVICSGQPTGRKKRNRGCFNNLIKGLKKIVMDACQTVKAYFDALITGDTDRLIEMMSLADHYVKIGTEPDEHIEGGENARDYFQNIVANAADIAIEYETS